MFSEASILVKRVNGVNGVDNMFKLATLIWVISIIVVTKAEGKDSMKIEDLSKYLVRVTEGNCC